MSKQSINDYSSTFSQVFSEQVKESLNQPTATTVTPVPVQEVVEPKPIVMMKKEKTFGKTFCLRIKREYVKPLEIFTRTSGVSLNDAINEAIRIMLGL